MNASRESDGRSLWRRLATSDVRDLIRGRITGAVDARHIIDQTNLTAPVKTALHQATKRASWRLAPRRRFAEQMIDHCESQLAAGMSAEGLLQDLAERRSKIRRFRREGATFTAVDALPEQLRTMVNEVVRRSRLYRREKLDVKRELGDHFSDGLAAGRTPEELARSFGDVSQAARLIRRAKIRSRSWRYHSCVWVTRAGLATLVVVTLIWSFFAIRYSVGRPNVTRHYLAEMDKDFAQIPEDDRAWPLYRQALIRLPEIEWSEHGPWNDEGELRHDLRQIVDEHQSVVGLLRKAALRRRLGFSFQDKSNREWLRVDAKLGPKEIVSFERVDGLVVDTLLPHIQNARQLGYLLAADAWVAAQRKDGSAVTEDLVTLLALADHINDSHSFLVTQRVSLALLDGAVQVNMRLLEAYPDLLTDEQLQHVSSRFNDYMRGGRLKCRWDAERMMFADAVQRMYSDDGKGDGFLTKQGINILDMYEPLFQTEPTPSHYDGFLDPLRASLVASRRELELLADKFFDFIDAESHKPRWLRRSVLDEPELSELFSAGPKRLRWRPLSLLAPASDGLVTAYDVAIQKRDAVVTIIALYRFQGKHEAWPNSLAELVPEFLPTVPLDQFDGNPLRYSTHNGMPRLYSVGRNGVDDQGEPPQSGAEAPYADEGDWILWPPDVKRGAVDNSQ